MLDHTFNGVPVSRMSDQDLDECLVEGVGINYNPDDTPENRAMAMERLRIEKLIRLLGLR